MLTKPTGLLRVRSLRENVSAGRSALIFVEQLHRFIGTKYPRDGPLASELTGGFASLLTDTCSRAWRQPPHVAQKERLFQCQSGSRPADLGKTAVKDVFSVATSCPISINTSLQRGVWRSALSRPL